MKKIVTIIIFIFFLLFTGLINPALAWDDCPFGKVNDPFPGSCSRYLDTNNDGICDHSQPKPNSIFKLDQPQSTDVAGKLKNDYHFGRLTMVLLAVYAFSAGLVKMKKINSLTQRKIWNVILLLSFLGVAFSGLAMVLRISYGINLPINIFWHVETGIVFTVVAVFHISRHLAYYKNLFKKSS